MAGASERPLVPWTDDDRELPPHMQLYDEAPSSAVYDPPVGAGPSTLPDDDDDDGDNMFRDMTFAEILEDLNSRFLINLPAEEYTLVRLYWQAEQAHWFYEDYLRPLNPQLPALSQRQFTQLIIASSPLYTDWEIDYDAVWAEYCAYKKMVPCCGGILLNQEGDKVLMVRGWKANAGWCFPRGKINSEESEAACAIREVEEETGFDMSDFIDPTAFIKTQVSAQEITMFLVLGVDESTVFETQTRKEIGAIEWVPLVDLPVWSNKKSPKRAGGKKEKKFYNVTPFVGGIKKFLSKNGINPHQPRRKERSGGRQQQVGAASGGRDLQPFAFDASPAPAGRELKPFAFGDEAPHSSGAPSTAIDHLFAKFIEKKDENAIAVESSTARTMDQLFAPEQDGGDKNDDDLLAKLLGNVGVVSDAAPPTLPPPDNKQSKLLSVLQGPHAPAPPPSTHQHNLLSMLASPKSDDEERASRQRALLESTLLGPGVTGSPANGGPSPAPPSNIMSPMTPLPQSQAPVPQQGLHAPPPLAQQWSPAPPQPGPPPGWSYPTQAPRRGPPAQVTPQAPQRASQPALQHSPMPQPQGYEYAPPTPPSQPRSDHQRNLLGTLFNKPGGGFPPVSPGYPGPSGGPGGPPAARGPAPPFPNYQPMPMPHVNHVNVNMGHQRQLSGGLPGQPGAGRPIGGAPGLPGQPGQMMGMGWGIPPPGMFGGFPNNPNGLGPGPNPFPHQSQQSGFHDFGQPQPHQTQQFQNHQQQHPQQAPLQQLQQQQGQGQHQHQPPARSAQTPPAMHQPVARPPVSGSLLGLAAGR